MKPEERPEFLWDMIKKPYCPGTLKKIAAYIEQLEAERLRMKAHILNMRARIEELEAELEVLRVRNTITME